MKQQGTWVQLPAGDVVRKMESDVQLDDTVFFDGPDAFAGVARLQARLDAEIDAAGGLEAWRNAGASQRRMAA